MSFRAADRLSDDEVTDLDHFLSARSALVTSHRHDLLYGRIHHPRWPLPSIAGLSIDQNVIQAAGLPVLTGKPHARYSPGVDVEVAWLEKIRARKTEDEVR